MDVHLSEESERFVRSQVEGGRFTSVDEALDAAIHLLRMRVPSTAQEESAAEDEFERRLMESGFLSAAYGPRPAPPPEWTFTPIEIEGEPLSETILRERR